MKITVDTNILIRAVVLDDAQQAVAAVKLLRDATLVAITLPCLCEMAWVLRKAYSFPSTDIARAIRAILAPAKVEVNRPSAEAGLSILDAGGDFADGVIQYEGTRLGGNAFASFDKKAVDLLSKQGKPTLLL